MFKTVLSTYLISLFTVAGRPRLSGEFLASSEFCAGMWPHQRASPWSPAPGQGLCCYILRTPVVLSAPQGALLSRGQAHGPHIPSLSMLHEQLCQIKWRELSRPWKQFGATWEGNFGVPVPGKRPRRGDVWAPALLMEAPSGFPDCKPTVDSVWVSATCLASSPLKCSRLSCGYLSGPPWPSLHSHHCRWEHEKEKTTQTNMALTFLPPSTQPHPLYGDTGLREVKHTLAGGLCRPECYWCVLH